MGDDDKVRRLLAAPPPPERPIEEYAQVAHTYLERELVKALNDARKRLSPRRVVDE